MTKALLLSFVLLSTQLIGQSYYTPESPINVAIPTIGADALQLSLAANKKNYSDNDIEELKQKIKLNNEVVAKELRAIEQRIDRGTIDYQDLKGAKDIEYIKKQIKIAETNKLDMRKALEDHLAKTWRSGIFVAAIPNIDPYQKSSFYVLQSQQALSKAAIQALNGTYIQRETTVSNMKEITDIIKSITSGQVKMGEEIMALPNNDSKVFLYCAKVKVAPVKESNASTANATQTNTDNIAVVDAVNDPAAKELVATSGLSEEQQAVLWKEINQAASDVANENKLTQDDQNDIVKRVYEMLAQTEDNIRLYKSALNRRETQLAAKIKEFSENKLDFQNIDSLINQFLQRIATQLKAENENWNQCKSKELLIQRGEVNAVPEPTAAIAKAADEMSTQMMTTYNSIIKSKELVKVVNLSVEEASAKSTVETYRDLEKLWLYPVPRNEGQFDLTIVGRFNVNNKVVATENKDTLSRPMTETESSSTWPESETFMLGDFPMTLRKVKGGTFNMGCTPGQSECEDVEKPVHAVTLKDFSISATEITVAQFQVFKDATGYQTEAETGGWSYLWDGISFRLMDGISWKHDTKGELQKDDNAPVVYISWHDANKFCEWLTTTKGVKYRLPTEAEWEYAARGGVNAKDYRFSGSNNESEVAWFGENADGDVHTVATKKPNDLGLYDMNGNVWEWCLDDYSSTYYQNSPPLNPCCTKGEQGKKVTRGGGWLSKSMYSTVSTRYRSFPSIRMNYIGFRVVREQNPKL